jgi:hypothetical protein
MAANETTTYIEITGWDTFQHSDATKRGRDPKWIKLYTRLHSDDDFLALSGHRRAVLFGLWLEYARSGRRIALDTRSLTRRLSLRVSTKDIDALNHAGFIEFRHDAVKTRGEERREEETRLERALPESGISLASINTTSSRNGHSPPEKPLLRKPGALDIRDCTCNTVYSTHHDGCPLALETAPEWS